MKACPARLVTLTSASSQLLGVVMLADCNRGVWDAPCEVLHARMSHHHDFPCGLSSSGRSGSRLSPTLRCNMRCRWQRWEKERQRTWTFDGGRAPGLQQPRGRPRHGRRQRRAPRSRAGADAADVRQRRRVRRQRRGACPTRGLAVRRRCEAGPAHITGCKIKVLRAILEAVCTDPRSMIPPADGSPLTVGLGSRLQHVLDDQPRRPNATLALPS